MATVTQLKNALSSGANIFNGGHTIGNNAVARVQAWFEADYAGQLDGASMSADDLSAWLLRQLAAKVKNYEQKILDETAGTAGELEE